MNQAERMGEAFLSHQIWKLRELRRRMESTLRQCTDSDLNWRPNPQSNSLGNLAAHVAGNLRWRYDHYIAGRPDIRDREAEFSPDLRLTVEEALQLLAGAFESAEEILRGIEPGRLLDPQPFRGRTTTLMEVISQTTAHYSEHLGQMLYIAKLRLGERYNLSLDPTR